MLALVVFATAWAHINLTGHLYKSVIVNPLSDTCQELCSSDPTCDGSMERMANATRNCILFGRGQTYRDVISVSKLQNYSGFVRRVCPYALDARRVCYPKSRTCVLCAGHETTYQQFAGKGFTIVISHDCCTRPGASGIVHLESSHVLKVSGLRFTVLSNDSTTIESEECPAIMIKSMDVQSVTIDNLGIACVDRSSTSVVSVSRIGRFVANVTNLSTTGAIAAVVVTGVPTENQQSGTIDLSGSYFSNITSQGRPPNAAVALANHVGDPISFGEISQPVVLQPMLSDSDKPPVYNPEPPRSLVIDISSYTDVYGADYAVEFQYRGAFEPSFENQGLRDLLGVQIATFLFLLFFIFMLNQDIIYKIVSGSYKRKTA